MNRHSCVRWLITLCAVLAAVVGAIVHGFHFVPSEFLRPVGVSLLLSLIAVYYYRRGEPNFVLCLNTLAQVVLFSAAYTVLMYLSATLGRPYIDQQLARCDEFLGFRVPSVLYWQGHYPIIGNLLGFAYETLLPQTAAVVAILGLWGDREPLERFVVRFMLCAIVTLLVFLAFPAEGPFSAYGFAPSASQARYLEHIRALRSGEFVTFTYQHAEGLITFPSFHTTWALLLALAYFHRPLLFYPFALLNSAVILSTMTTGWHYLSDVLAGIVVYAVVLLATRLMEPPTDGLERTTTRVSAT